MKKIGLICLAVVLALGGLGIGFAHWSDQLYVNGTVKTGDVVVGFVSQETDDDNDVGGYVKLPDTGIDPVAGEECPTVCTLCTPNVEGKDVASTTCELSIQKKRCDGTDAVHLDQPCMEKMTITMDKVYPQYNPSVYFDIANCGSIPVEIVGAWIIDGPPGVDPADKATWIPLPKCTMVQVDIDGDGDEDIGIGFSKLFEPEDQQIDPCEVDQYDLHFCIKQDAEQCTTFSFEIKLEAIQWNKA